MRRFLLPVFIAFTAVRLLFPEDNRGFTEDEISRSLLTRGRVRQLEAGRVVDELRVSADGRWIVYSAFAEDIKSNELWILSADGSARKRIDAPYGYKNCPVLWGGQAGSLPGSGVRRPLSVFVSLAGGKDGIADGIYFRSLEEAGAKWSLWEKGSFRDLAVSDDERFLMASSGNWNVQTIRSVVRVWPLGPDARKSGASYTLAAELKGQVHKIAMGPDDGTLFFECTVDKAGSYYGVSNIYAAPNRAASTAVLLFEDASQPSIRGGKTGGALYFKQGSNSVIAFDLVTKASERAIELVGAYPNGLAYDRANGRLLLGLQMSASAAGLFAVWTK